MAETNRLYDWLSSIEVNECNIFDILNTEDKRNLMYKYFNKKEKMEELCEELVLKQNNEDETYLKFIENIVLLYPMTKKLIIKLNQEQLKVNGKTIPALLRNTKYVEGFYSGVLKGFEDLIKEANNNSAIKKLDDEFEELKEKVEEYKKKIEELRKKETNETISKAKERDQLKKKFEELKITTDIEKLNKEIANYKEKIEEKAKEKEEKKKQKNDLYEELKKLELDNFEEKEKEAIRILASIWKKDESNN